MNSLLFIALAAGAILLLSGSKAITASIALIPQQYADYMSGPNIVVCPYDMVISNTSQSVMYVQSIATRCLATYPAKLYGYAPDKGSYDFNGDSIFNIAINPGESQSIGSMVQVDQARKWLNLDENHEVPFEVIVNVVVGGKIHTIKQTVIAQLTDIDD